MLHWTMTANFEGAKHFKYDLAEVLSLYLLAPTTIIQLIITCLCPIIIFIHSQEWTNDIININCQWLRTQLERNWHKPTHHEVSHNFLQLIKMFWTLYCQCQFIIDNICHCVGLQSRSSIGNCIKLVFLKIYS